MDEEGGKIDDGRMRRGREGSERGSGRNGEQREKIVDDRET